MSLCHRNGLWLFSWRLATESAVYRIGRLQIDIICLHIVAFLCISVCAYVCHWQNEGSACSLRETRDHFKNQTNYSRLSKQVLYLRSCKQLYLVCEKSFPFQTIHHCSIVLHIQQWRSACSLKWFFTPQKYGTCKRKKILLKIKIVRYHQKIYQLTTVYLFFS